MDVADSGAEGLAVARERSPDLVILDVMMPGLDGWDVLRRLRAADAQLPILMLTAKDAPADQVQGLDLGADDYVVKPFTFDVLAARVRAALRHHQSKQARGAALSGLDARHRYPPGSQKRPRN